MRPEDLDPTRVLQFLLFLAAFGAGMEVAQMTKPLPKWARKSPSQRRGALYSMAIVVVILGGIWVVHLLEQAFP